MCAFSWLTGSVSRDPETVRPLMFFAATFLLSWSIWVPLMLIRLDVLPPWVPVATLTPVAFLGVLMPAVAATILTARAAGRPGVRRLYSRLHLWRVGRWWLPVLLLQPAVLATTTVVYNAVAGDPVRAAPGLTVGALLSTVVFLLISSTGEEVGWRGLALPALQARHGPVLSSIVLALVTATWHLPYWTILGVPIDYGGWYLAFNYVFIVALTFQLTWLVNHTGGSVLVAVAFHLVFNVVNVAILPVTASTGAFALLTAVESGIALALVARLPPPDPRPSQRHRSTLA
jgi:membrane protease YdiL (CAAX protease family)